MNYKNRFLEIRSYWFISLFLHILWIPSFGIIQTGFTQNMTVRPTYLSVQNARTPAARPTAIRGLQMNEIQISGARLEAESNTRAVFSNNETPQSDNKRLYYWDKGTDRLINTLIDGLSGTVIMPEDGRYMIFLYNESLTGNDLDGDGILQVILRLYHFASGQKVNLGVPARTLYNTPTTTDPNKSNFEYSLKNHILVFSVSQNQPNLYYERTAPWNILDLNDLLIKIEGTPTSVPTPTPIGTSTMTPTPTLSPSPTLSATPSRSPTPTLSPTKTLKPTIPPEFRSRADINGDGDVNLLDLLLFRLYWQ